MANQTYRAPESSIPEGVELFDRAWVQQFYTEARMIVRLIAVDPRPRKGEQDLRVYQVPEGSRELELLQELFDAAKIEHALVGAPTRGKK